MALPATTAALDRLMMPVAMESATGGLVPGLPIPPIPSKKNPLDAITSVTDAMLATPAPGEWLMWRRTWDAHGYSPLDQINRNNVGELRPTWTWSLPNGTNEATPLYHDGVLFVHSFGDRVQALDAATGDLLWQYSRRLPEGKAASNKRNLAIYGDRLFLGTSDVHVIALEVKTGRVVWDRAIADFKEYDLTSGPLIARGKVIVGTVSGQAGGGNHIVALDAQTGAESWRFATIPRPGEPGGNSWNDLPYELRIGASVWVAGSYDPGLNLVYFGIAQTYKTGGLLKAVARPGITNDALYTDATVALDPDNGRLVWHFQHLPNDQWNQDWAFVRTIFTTPVAGVPTKVVASAGKLGIYDLLDARTGKYVSSMDLGIQDIVSAIDPKTGAKTINPAAMPGRGRTVTVCPHAGGGKSWPPESYNPETRVMFVPLVETCMDMVPVGPDEQQNLTSGVRWLLRPRPESDGNYGRLQAIQLETGKTLWLNRQRAPVSSGVLSTAGGLVFASAADRGFAAYDDRTGEELWRLRLNDVPRSAPISYLLNGKQYIAQTVGSGGAEFPGLIPEIRNPPNRGAAIWVFALPDRKPPESQPDSTMYYVSAAGADATGAPGRPNRPYRSPAGAYAAIPAHITNSPGDHIIEITDGSTYGQLTMAPRKTDATHRIILRAARGMRPVLDADSKADGSAGVDGSDNPALRIQANHVVVQRLHFRNTNIVSGINSEVMVQLVGSNAAIEDNFFDGNGRTPTATDMFLLICNTAADNLISGNRFDYSGGKSLIHITASCGGGSPGKQTIRNNALSRFGNNPQMICAGINFGGQRGTFAGNNSIVENNTIYDNGGGCYGLLDTNGSSLTVRDNIFSRITGHRYAVGCNGATGTSSGVAYNSVMFGNTHDVESSCWSLSNTTQGDPLFVDPGASPPDLRVKSASGGRSSPPRLVPDTRSTIILSLKTATGAPSRCSNQFLASMYFTDPKSISAFYKESSYGLLALTGIVAGPYVVALGSDWTPASVASQADAAASAAGINLADYAQRVYIVPKEADPMPIQSAWGGTTMGTRSQFWVRDYWCSSRWLAAHELGHNFGLNHASTPADGYGDFSSPMGGRVDPSSDPATWNQVSHFNIAEKISLGWIPENAVRTVDMSARFRVAPVETVPAAEQVQALKIKGANDGTDHYYISYRQALGFSSVLTPQYVGTTSITRWNGRVGSKTCLLANLADGQAFVDTSGIMITQTSHNVTQATITVTFGAASIENARVICP